MGAVNGVLFKDADLAAMHCNRNGQPSVLPSLTLPAVSGNHDQAHVLMG
jgi:hypothetical protein